VAARIFSDLLEVRDVMTVPLEHYRGIDVLEDVKVGKIDLPDLHDRSVLLIDDIADSGASLQKISELLIDKIYRLKTLCLFKKNSSIFTPDFYQKETDAWIIFPWDRLEALKALENKGISMEEITKAGFNDSMLHRLRGLSMTDE